MKSNSVRILIWNNYLSTRGGGEKSTLDYAQYFGLRFPESEIIILSWDTQFTGAQDYAGYFGMRLCRTIRLASISECLSPLKRILFRSKVLRVAFESRIIRNRFPDIDLFINHTAASLCGAIGKRNIYALMFPFAGNSTKFFKNQIGKIWMKWILRKYDQVFANSHFTKRIAERTYGKMPTCQVIYPSFESNLATGMQRKKPGIRILSIGRFSTEGHKKRQDLLLKAFAALSKVAPTARLTLIGSLDLQNHADMEFFHSLEKTVRESKLRVHLEPNATTSKKIAALKEANVFWLGTGLYESFPPRDIEKEHFGIVVLEAMAAGLVPFTYSDGGVIEIYEDAKSGYRCDSLLEFSEKTQAHATLPRLEKKKIELAVSKQVKSFDWRHFMRRLDAALMP
jgi:glycosyltransferase involved in cell wall biosynthesis